MESFAAALQKTVKYPNLRILGLNAPIPDCCSFDYHAAAEASHWSKDNGKSLYCDDFGVSTSEDDNGLGEEEIDHTQWDELESEWEESSEEEEEEGDLSIPEKNGLVTPAEGLVTPSRLISDVRHGDIGHDRAAQEDDRKRDYNETSVMSQLLPEKRTDRIGASMMGSTHVYDLTGAIAVVEVVVVPVAGPSIAKKWSSWRWIRPNWT